ncbi:MAG: hypothetical protein M3360_11340 [Actinomycetota bacterium]|nr:hypothetical protein [Actinomycetota bacterium]
MGSRTRSGTVALSAVLALTLMGACGSGDAETPKTSVGSQRQESEPRENDGSGHRREHEDTDKDRDRGEDKDKDEDGATRQDDSQAIKVEVSGGEVNGVGPTVEVAVGERVALEVASDTDDEVHVHGYDVVAAVSPSQPAQLGFVADLPGAWEVELENAGMLLFELRVQ